MAFKKNNPGCPCCTEVCLIQSNDLTSLADLTGNFTLDDAANFDYDATLGGIKISAVSQTATAKTPHPQSPYPPRVEIEFYGDNVGSQVRIILGGSIIIQVTVGDGTSDLDILDASDDSELVDTVTCDGVDRDEWHRLTVCYDPDLTNIAAVLYDLSSGTTYQSCTHYPAGGALGRYAAFGTGPAHVDNVYVRNFRYWRLWYCGDSPYTTDCHVDDGGYYDYYYEIPVRTRCYQCGCDYPCDFCDNPDDWPSAAIASISGLSGTVACTNCSDFDGSYYLSPDSDPNACAFVERYSISCVPGIETPQCSWEPFISIRVYAVADFLGVWLVCYVQIWANGTPKPGQPGPCSTLSKLYTYGKIIGTNPIDCVQELLLAGAISLPFISSSGSYEICSQPTVTVQFQ